MAHPFSFPPYHDFNPPQLFATPSPISITAMTGLQTQFPLNPCPFTCLRPKNVLLKLGLYTSKLDIYNTSLLNCTFSKSLTNNQAKLIVPYNQAINVRIITKDIKKEDRLCMKSPPKEGGIVQRVFLKLIPPLSVSTSGESNMI